MQGRRESGTKKGEGRPRVEEVLIPRGRLDERGNLGTRNSNPAGGGHVKRDQPPPRLSSLDRRDGTTRYGVHGRRPGGRRQCRHEEAGWKRQLTEQALAGTQQSRALKKATQVSGATDGPTTCGARARDADYGVTTQRRGSLGRGGLCRGQGDCWALRANGAEESKRAEERRRNVGLRGTADERKFAIAVMGQAQVARAGVRGMVSRLVRRTRAGACARSSRRGPDGR